MTHMHMTTWAIAIILFVVAIVMQKNGKDSASKIVQMILRLFYILIIATGILLITGMDSIPYPVKYTLKIASGLLVIGFMEMILARVKKSKPIMMFIILLAVVFGAALYLGFNLPL